MFTDRLVRKIPIIIGTAKDECAMRFVAREGDKKILRIIHQQQAEAIISNLTMDHYEFHNNRLITEGCFYEYIYSLKHPNKPAATLSLSLMEMLSQFMYHAPVVRMTESYERLGSNVYLYSFDHVSDSLFGEDDEWKGVFHGTDLVFLFDVDVDFATHYSYRNWQIDRRVAEIFSEMITNFARDGNPTPPDSDLPKWEPFNGSLFNYLSVTDNPRMRNGFHWKGDAFWNKYARKLDAVDVGNLRHISQLSRQLEGYQLATWILLSTTTFFAVVLMGLAFYCTRKDSEEAEL